MWSPGFEPNTSAGPSSRALHPQGRSAGREWRRDVCHALALCHSEAASSSLARPTPDVVSAYLSLEHAQAALGAAPGRAQGLAAKVDEAVAEYGPEFALEALALPLSSQGTFDPRLRAARAQGARVLRALLWARGPQGELSPRLKGRRDEFTQQALRLLSAPEAADLFFEAPKAPQGMPHTTSPHQVMSACVAALAAGFTQRSVRRVRQAAAQLTQLARTQPFQAAPPVAVAEVDTLAAEGAAEATAAAAAHALVDARVALCVARLLLGETAEALDAISDDAGARAMVGRFPSPLAGMVALAERWLAEQALPRFRDTAMGGPASCSPSLSLWFATPAVAAALDDSLATAPMRALAELADARAAGASRRAERALGAAPEYRPPSASGRLTSLASSATPLGAALALAAVLAAASLILPSRAPPRPLPVSAAAARIASAAAAASRNSVELLADAATGVLRGGAAQPMDVSLASTVIRRWQGIKASALGGRHDVSSLDGVLEGPMLRQWRSRAEDVRHNGFYWDYVLLNLRVDSLRVSPTGDSARVEATLTEAALLHDAAQPGAEQEAYESTYRARYELVRKGGAGGGARAWRIVAGTVLY